ncbi:hypothetical protein SISNIDRAFT_460053 [Sistotremastrum niveocremeum HHB9708]|uniref:Uncharacterized protein n=2 Tax=Sistotremastraceae TaxID=3402574 RepID=A0A164NYY8_9AGAM|nr:hypothetical protein SISNIDRAFT_460053 [Sistotremastrum niveocremeum HHB9708]KZT36511.1 hypothetical protein SISSUDRAFT_1049739 [Sistotremastrum suecicum HHB10207 ss-3]
MAAGNGHDDILEYILPLVEPSLLSTANSSLSTPLHWAALNSHLKAMQLLVEFPSGPQADLIDQKNSAGRTPLGEAEMAGWEEGAQYLVSKMKLDETTAGDGEATAEADEVVTGDIEVEIEDADGQIARMKLDGSSSSSATAPPPTTTSG